MACESTGKNDRRVNQFNKIRLLNDIANQIAAYGVQNGYKTLMDDVDLNCGAVPEGDFDHVIDLSAPHQFLSLYMQIAESRFAYAVTALLKMSPDYMKILEEFCTRVGRELDLEQAEDAEKAFEMFQAIVLDGMPCDETKKIDEKSPERVVWEKVEDTHEAAWKKAGGDISVYYRLLKCFADGMFEKSGISLSVEKDSLFTLSRQ